MTTPPPPASHAGAGTGLVLVRHAHDGPLPIPDPPLSPLGRAQAAALATRLAGPFDALYTGPRRRTRETAAILGAALGLEPIVDQSLREVPSGPGALLACLRLARFTRRLPSGRRILIVTHGGTLRCLLLCSEGLARLPWLLRQPPPCQPFACRARSPARGFRGPLALLLAGMALGLLATPGPWPSPVTLASYLVALGVYRLCARLAERGRTGLAVVALIAAALALLPLAFGPSPLANRKVTAFNAWAYAAGARLPGLVSPAPHPNGVAAALACGLALAAAAACWGRGRARRLGALGAWLLAASLALTASRAGWLAGAGALSALAARHGRRRATRALALAGLVILLLVLAGRQPLPGQPALHSTASLGQRLERWRTSLALLSERPLTGLGLGRFPAAYARVAPARERPAKTPNNTALQLWADAGLLGLAAWAWALARAGRVLRRMHKDAPTMPGWAAPGLGAALVALTVHGLFETNTAIVWASGGAYRHLASPLPWALWGLLAGLSAQRPPRPWHRPSPSVLRRVIASVRRCLQTRGRVKT